MEFVDADFPTLNCLDQLTEDIRHCFTVCLTDVFICFRITGGELFERVIDENFELDEAACEKFMRQILQGVEYIHSQHVIHLDLKVPVTFKYHGLQKYSFFEIINDFSVKCLSAYHDRSRD